MIVVVNKGKVAHDHAMRALDLLLSEKWTFETLGLVRYELGQAYANLKKHLKTGHCVCGDKLKDLEFYKSVLLDVNTAISTSSLSVIPIVQEELMDYFSVRKECHRCIHSLLTKDDKYLTDFI